MLNSGPRASLLVQWLGIHLVMQGTRVQSLIWDDSTCHRATKPCTTTTGSVLLILEVTTTEPIKRDLPKPMCQKSPHSTTEATTRRSPHTTMKSSLSLLQPERACMQQGRPTIAKTQNERNTFLKGTNNSPKMQ